MFGCYTKFPLDSDLLLARRILGLLLSFTGLLCALTSGTGSDTSTVDGVEGRELLLVLLDSAEFNHWLGLHERHEWTSQLCGQFAFLLGGFALAQLTVLVDREEDQLVLVFLQALNVLLTRLDGLVAATLVDCNSDGAGESGGETSGLK